MKALLTIFTLVITISISAQNFTGKAVYKTSRKSTFKVKDDKGMNDKMQEEIRKRLQKMNQKTFILNFDNYTSTYVEEINLKAPKPQVGGRQVMVMSFGGSGNGSIYFKNTKENRFSNKTEIMGKIFLVKDELPKQDWVMTSETKNIGTYTCYKATFTREVESKKMTINNGEPKEETITETVVTTAWYTPQIPVSNGPKNYQGLPGLILEINDGKSTIVCTEIILNPTEKIKINEPTKGKVVTLNEYRKISDEKSKEMMERFKSRKGVDLGNGTTIKFGG